MAQQLDDMGFCMVTEEEAERARAAFVSTVVKGDEKFKFNTNSFIQIQKFIR